jgi:hypothetical protein
MRQYECPFSGRKLFALTIEELGRKVQAHNDLWHTSNTLATCRPMSEPTPIRRAYHNTTAVAYAK